MFIGVDLPAPFSPMMAWTSPAASAADTSRSAAIEPKLLVIPRASKTAAPMTPPSRHREWAARDRPRATSLDQAAQSAFVMKRDQVSWSIGIVWFSFITTMERTAR